MSDVDDDMIEILEKYDSTSKELCNAQARANWDVQTDVGNKENEVAQVI